ncbi:hypothetical protein ECDEC1B_1796 [Escherichia coli DEC1B]|nr:hypothetical protein ECDEC1B_1796 [Escherichia coli DEC1B]
MTSPHVVPHFLKRHKPEKKMIKDTNEKNTVISFIFAP